jgi:hypothetical protein
MAVKKSSVENSQSSSGVPSEQLRESWEYGAMSTVGSRMWREDFKYAVVQWYLEYVIQL